MKVLLRRWQRGPPCAGEGWPTAWAIVKASISAAAWEVKTSCRLEDYVYQLPWHPKHFWRCKLLMHMQ